MQLTQQEALDTLVQLQAWRRGQDNKEPDLNRVGYATDVAIVAIELVIKSQAIAAVKS